MKKFIIAGALLLTLVIVPQSAHAQTTAELQAIIASLQAQLTALIAQLAALQNGTNQPPVVVASSTGSLSVNLWKNPTLTLQYDESQAETLRVRFVYSVTAGKQAVYLRTDPTAFTSLHAKTQVAAIPTYKSIKTSSSDAPITACGMDGAKYDCFLIRAGETKNFQTDVTYSPREMFAGDYYISLDGLLYAISGRGNVYDVTASNRHTNSVTIVGEKSPYITSFTSPVKAGDFVVMKGVRLGGQPVLMGSAYPVLDSEVLYNGTEAGFRVDPRTPSGIYNLQITTQAYGNSNIVKLEVQGSGTVTNPAITVISPNGGESYVSGQDTIQAKWSYSNLNPSPKIKIYLYHPVLGEILSYNYDQASSSGKDSYSFLIPHAVTTGQYKIGVCDMNTDRPDLPGKSVCDLSDNYFTITYPSAQPQTVTVTNPNGGESWALGSRQYIRWSTTGTTGTERVRIRLVDPLGDERKLIASDLPNTGLAAWTVGNYELGTVGVSRYNIKVCIKGATGADAVCDRGDARFTITDVTAATRVQMAAVLQSVQTIINSLFGIGS